MKWKTIAITFNIEFHFEHFSICVCIYIGCRTTALIKFTWNKQLNWCSFLQLLQVLLLKWSNGCNSIFSVCQRICVQKSCSKWIECRAENIEIKNNCYHIYKGFKPLINEAERHTAHCTYSIYLILGTANSKFKNQESKFSWNPNEKKCFFCSLFAVWESIELECR